MAARGVSRRAFEVFVRRIPWNVEENELRKYFTQFGPVKKCILPFVLNINVRYEIQDKHKNFLLFFHYHIWNNSKNVETGFHKGFGWIGFATEESRNKALLKDHFFEGSQLEVKRQEKTVR